MKKKKNIILVLSILLIMLIIFAAVLIKKISITSSQKESITELRESISSIQVENSKIEETISEGEDESYIEKVARDNNFVFPEERIYYDSDATDVQ